MNMLYEILGVGPLVIPPIVWILSALSAGLYGTGKVMEAKNTGDLGKAQIDLQKDQMKAQGTASKDTMAYLEKMITGDRAFQKEGKATDFNNMMQMLLEQANITSKTNAQSHGFDMENMKAQGQQTMDMAKMGLQEQRITQSLQNNSENYRAFVSALSNMGTRGVTDTKAQMFSSPNEIPLNLLLQ